MHRNSLVADGRNGLHVIQLISPDTVRVHKRSARDPIRNDRDLSRES
jgi:hypothetical protein